MAGSRRRRRPGLARGRARALGQREGRKTLSRICEERLFAHAEVLSEGSLRGESYYGSTMLTVSLSDLDLRGIDDPEIAEVLAGSVRLRLRAIRIARAEAQRRVPGHRLGTAQVESRVTVDQGRLLVDVDLEVPLDHQGVESESL